MSSDITNGGHAQLTGEMNKTTKPERSEVTAGQIAADLCTDEQRVEGGAGKNCDAMNEYLEEQTAAVAMTTDVSQKDTDAIEVTGEKHCVVTNGVGVRGETEVMADGRSDNDVDVNDVDFSIHDSMGKQSGSTALQSNDTLSTNGKPSNLSQHEQSSTTNSLSKSSAATDIKHDRSEKVDNYPEGEESHLGENSIASENTSPSEHSSQHDTSKDDAEELSDMQAVKKTQLFQPNITSLDISNISLEHPSTDSALKEFFTANKKMRKFCISWPLLNNFTLEFIANNSPELRYLSLIDCESLSSAGIICLNKCQYLEHLDLKGVCFISDAGLAPLLTNTDSCLKYLCVAEANITDSSMQRVSKYLATKIQNFDISWCEEVTDVGIRSVVESCTSLKSLSIRQCPTSDETLLCLADNCTKLTDLNLCGVGDIEDEVVVAIARQLSLLEKIDLSWNPNLTDVAISTLLLSCTLLKEAILCGLKCISSKPFLPIVADYPRWKRCKSLLSLKLKERKLLEENGDPHLSSDEEYEDLYIPHRSTTYSPCLRHIDMEYCNQIDDDLIAEIVAICRGTLKVRDYYGQQVEPKLLKF
ncbi:uncharacterized protein [Ptychodera flava]|uniref:uncharacterized protein n=1 Tax=Ptychodera flava TaxID=63121 RepID=UPI00396A2A04